MKKIILLFSMILTTSFVVAQADVISKHSGELVATLKLHKPQKKNRRKIIKKEKSFAHAKLFLFLSKKLSLRPIIKKLWHNQLNRI